MTAPHGGSRNKPARAIVYVHDTLLPLPIANTVNVTKSCAAFAANGHPVTLVHYRRTGSIEDYYGLAAPFRILSLPLEPGRRFAVRILAWTAAIIARSTGALVYARKAAILLPAAQLGCPVALEVHGPIGDNQPGSRAAFEALLRSKRLRRVICISNALARQIEREWPAAASKIFVAHDATDIGNLMKSPRRVRGARPLLAYAGHLYPGKGIEVIAELAANRPDWDFRVIGGRPEDVATWQDKTDGLRNIDFTGSVPHSEVPLRLMKADVVLAPYGRKVIVSDGKSDVAQWMSPLKVFEYMALAKPMVASDLPVLREILRDRDNARLAAPGDAKDWERVISELLADRRAGAAIGRRARADVEQHYSWQSRAAAIAEALDR